jgi:aryl-alcohol dehydrogenase-like predicted oxidoreductase
LTLVQLAIAWAMRLPIISCVLVGAKSPAQVEEHLGAVEVTFSDDELEHIKGILAEAPRVTPETPLRNSTR